LCNHPAMAREDRKRDQALDPIGRLFPLSVSIGIGILYVMGCIRRVYLRLRKSKPDTDEPK
jgi:hypothetical protein